MRDFQIAILGEQASGKTSLIQKYLLDKFPENYEATKAFDLRTAEKLLNDERLNVKIYELEYGYIKDIAEQYVKTSRAILVTICPWENQDDCFTLKTEKILKAEIDKGISTVNEYKTQNHAPAIFLVFTNSDRSPSGSDNIGNVAIAYAKKQKISGYFFCSAKEGANATTLFNQIINHCEKLSLKTKRSSPQLFATQTGGSIVQPNTDNTSTSPKKNEPTHHPTLCNLI